MAAQKPPPRSPSPSPPAGLPPPPPPSTGEHAEEQPKHGEKGAADGPIAKRAAAEGGTSESELEDAADDEGEFVAVKLSEIRKDVQCPICLGIIRKTRTVMECLHRFCRECIDKSMRLGNHECPACRAHCTSRRSLRDDPNYDALIAALYPDIDKYEEEELAFNQEEDDRNKQIQASIAEAFRKQSEVIGQKSIARDSAGALVRRARRNVRGRQNKYFRGRGRGRASRAGSCDVAMPCSGDEEGANDENCGKEPSSAEESSPEKKQKRLTKWPTPRSSPARTECNEEVASDDKDDAGNARESFSTSLRAWGKNGTRSQTRHGHVSSSNGRLVKGGRTIRLVERLRKSDDNDGECDVHLYLHPADGQTLPSLEKPYLCCRQTLSVKQLSQFVASQTSHKGEEVRIYAVKPLGSDDQEKRTHLEELAGEERLSDLRSQFTFPNGGLRLMYGVR